MEKEHVSQVYDAIAESFSKTRVAIWKGVDEFLSSLPENSVVLDVGCGNGKYENCGRYRRLTFIGLDSCMPLLRIAAEGVANADYVGASALALPFADESFDFVISIAVMHHLREKRETFASELRRVLKPGGRAYVTVWARGAEKNTWKHLGNNDYLVPWMNDQMRYYHLYEKEELINALGGADQIDWERDNWCATIRKA